MNMKLSIIAASILLMSFYISSIYDIKLNSITGKPIDMGMYKGKKILVTPFDAVLPDTKQLKYLDSLQENDKNISIIAVPALDFSESKTLPNLMRLKDSLNLKFVITTPAYVKRSEKQLQLFKFLTMEKENGHFNEDVEEPDQLYFIDATGMLYSILKKQTPRSVIDEIRLQKQ